MMCCVLLEQWTFTCYERYILYYHDYEMIYVQINWIKKIMYNTQITNTHIIYIHLKMIWYDIHTYMYTNEMNTKSCIYYRYTFKNDMQMIQDEGALEP